MVSYFKKTKLKNLEDISRLSTMKSLGTNEISEFCKSQVYNTCTINIFYVKTEKTLSYSLSLFKFGRQPVLVIYRIQWRYTHTSAPLPPSLLNFYSKFCKPNKNFQHFKKEISIAILFLIFHAVDIHIFTKHNWSGSGENYGWTETTLERAKNWGTIYMRYRALQKVSTQFHSWFLWGWFNSSRNYFVNTC